MRKITLLSVICFVFFTKNYSQQVLPNDASFFGQAAYNRPINYNIGDGHYEAMGIFKNSTSIGGGFNFYSNKVLFSSLLKYTYSEGSANGWNGGQGGGSGFSADFYLGKMSAEFEISSSFKRAKRLFLGGGLVFGDALFKNIVGTKNSFSGYNGSNSEKLGNGYFGSAYGGMLLDIKYFISFSENRSANTAIGIKYYHTTSIIPYKNSLSEFEFYFSYNLWKKRKPEEPKTPEEPKEPVNWNKQNGGN